MVARPSGSSVKITWYCSPPAAAPRFDELRVARGHSVVFQPALAALGVAASVADRDGDHRGHSFLGDQIVQRREQQRIGSVRSDDERCRASRDVLLRNIDGDTARVRRRMAGGHDQLSRIGGIGVLKVPAPLQCRLQFAVRRIH